MPLQENRSDRLARLLLMTALVSIGLGISLLALISLWGAGN
ncbi:MAG TPA: hypothetical protein VH206_15280 [Xanthobacteraceae bacterium]|jgi:hypothetical protein|nr:hypothetical protein [Xanthobacteraceae bacterium]